MKEWFSDPSKWCQQAFGLDKEGQKLWPENISKSVSCCLVGAAIMCYGMGNTSDVEIKMCDYINMISDATIPSQWNDSPRRRFEDIVKLVNDLDI